MEENKQIDLGSFTLYDSAPLNTSNVSDIEDLITQRMISNIYYAFESAVSAKKQQITALESLPEEEQIHDFETAKLYFKLPEASILLPRSQRIPEKKTLTKWQKFAKENGIKKRKKFALKYDPQLKKNVARWGGRSKKNAFQAAIMEEKVPGRNPFEDAKNERKLAKQNQKLRQLKNKDFRERNSSK